VRQERVELARKDCLRGRIGTGGLEEAVVADHGEHPAFTGDLALGIAHVAGGDEVGEGAQAAEVVVVERRRRVLAPERDHRVVGDVLGELRGEPTPDEADERGHHLVVEDSEGFALHARDFRSSEDRSIGGALARRLLHGSNA